MRRKRGFNVFAPHRGEQKQVRQRAGRQPGKSASLARAPERQASVAVDAMPPDTRGIHPFAGHRFHRVSEDRFHAADFDCHDVAAYRCGSR
jgi:hypothetical protein